MTSPPYWALRNYQSPPQIWDENENCKHIWGNKNLTLRHKSGETNPGKEAWYKNKGASDDEGNQFCSLCRAWRGSLGLEPTFRLFIQHLLQIFDEVKRVLKKTGTCWINLGDTYGGSGCGTNDYRTEASKSIQGIGKNRNLYKTGGIAQKINYPAKSLCQIPFRFAIDMVDRGWILRNTIIWHKPNCMPASVKDRFIVDFEYVFFFVKNKKYYFEQQFEPHQSYDERNISKRQMNYRGKFDKDIAETLNSPRARMTRKKYNPESFYSPKGRNKRTVWTIPTSPFKDAHFATFPEALITLMIKAGCPENGVVLDPFIGAGTTAIVALKLKRHYLGIELNEEYCQMARKRITEAQTQLKLDFRG